MAKTPVKSTPPGAREARPSVADLLATIGELEAELEALRVSAAKEEIYVVDGYFIAVRPGTDVPLVGRCPTLHALGQGSTFDEVVADLREAVKVALEGRAYFGRPIPPKDLDAKGLD